jgi:hypothetical protein
MGVLAFFGSELMLEAAIRYRGAQILPKQWMYQWMSDWLKSVGSFELSVGNRPVSIGGKNRPLTAAKILEGGNGLGKLQGNNK